MSLKISFEDMKIDLQMSLHNLKFFMCMSSKPPRVCIWFLSLQQITNKFWCCWPNLLLVFMLPELPLCAKPHQRPKCQSWVTTSGPSFHMITTPSTTFQECSNDGCHSLPPQCQESSPHEYAHGRLRRRNPPSNASWERGKTECIPPLRKGCVLLSLLLFAWTSWSYPSPTSSSSQKLSASRLRPYAFPRHIPKRNAICHDPHSWTYIISGAQPVRSPLNTLTLRKRRRSSNSASKSGVTCLLPNFLLS